MKSPEALTYWHFINSKGSMTIQWVGQGQRSIARTWVGDWWRSTPLKRTRQSSTRSRSSPGEKRGSSSGWVWQINNNKEYQIKTQMQGLTDRRHEGFFVLESTGQHIHISETKRLENRSFWSWSQDELKTQYKLQNKTLNCPRQPKLS